VLAVVSAGLSIDPDTDFSPLQPSLASHELAPDDDQRSVTLSPAPTFDALGTMLTLGGGV
jgi:hypothetical protein